MLVFSAESGRLVIQTRPVIGDENPDHVHGQVQIGGAVVFVLGPGAGASDQPGIHHFYDQYDFV